MNHTINTIMLGNLISLVGCTLMVLVGFLQKKKTILTVQCFQFGIQGIANLTLGGVTGFISGIISIIRNIAFSANRNTFFLKIFFMVLQVVLSLGALDGGFVDWLPIFAAAAYTFVLDTKKETVLKMSIIGAQVLWLIYDLCYVNYISAAFDVFTIISNSIGILMIRKSAATSE